MTTQTTTPIAAAAAAAAALSQVEIFRPGKHRATSGQLIEFSAADVADIAAAYDPALHEAPHVVGHPRTDAPAYGWVRGLAVNDAGRLVVTESRQVNADFADQLLAGAYKKRSASFFPPDHPNSPTPGKWYLKHVGWLGAMPPAVKGLADPSFADEADDQVVTFGDWEDELQAGLWRRMREWFIAQFGAETADRVVPAYEVDALQREAMRPDPEEAAASTASPTPAYADTTAGASVPTTTATAAPSGQAALDARAADLDAREARLREQEAEQGRLARSARTAGIAAFADGLITQGRLLPAERARIVSVLEALPDEARVEFAEGDGQAQQLGALEAFQGFLKALPPRVEFAELAGTQRTTGSGLDVTDSQAIARAAQDFADAEAKAGRAVSIAAAVEHVTAQAGAADA